MSYSFVYTAAALLGLLTPMDQALMVALEAPTATGGTIEMPDPPPLPLRPEGGQWRTGREPRWRPQAPQGPVIGHTVHLASYLGDTWAKRGWSELRKRAPALAAYEPTYRDAQVAVLGPVIRLTIGDFPNFQRARDVCAALKPPLEYCAPLALRAE